MESFVNSSCLFHKESSLCFFNYLKNLQPFQKAEAEEVAALLSSAQSTPTGSKKETTPKNMCKNYHPKIVETAWYQW